jgi:hypothetical protein
MHQTFYIDIDEEITSIVDRLRKSRSKEVIVVVPKRALLVQSIVNLKLLKKEAEKMGRQISIVTQDKLGKMLIEKVGINVEEKLDDIEGEEVSVAEIETESRVVVADAEYDLPKNDSKNRLDRLGSASYFEEDLDEDKYSEKITKFKDIAPIARNKTKGAFQEEPNSEIEQLLNKELVTEIGPDIEKVVKLRKKPTFDIAKSANVEDENVESIGVSNISFNEQKKFVYDDYEKLTMEDENRKREAIRSQNNRIGDFNNSDRVDNFFQGRDLSGRPNPFENKKQGEIELSSGLWKYVVSLGILIVVVFALIGGYIFLPKVDVKIITKNKEQSFDAQIKGDTQTLLASKDAIPVKLLPVENEFTGTYKATGSKSTVSQKAKGTITIYNEYSNSPQPLIASTRFETSDGKIFRLIKGISVPGTSTSGGETKPGVIEADVVADSAGSEYNIGPSTFSIPGFKDSGSEKYAKFYAKSASSMLGGGTSGSMAESISSTDIANAKSKALVELTNSIKEKIKNMTIDGGVVLDDAIDMGEVSYSSSNLEGEVVNEFTVTAKAKANVIVFSENDLREALKIKAMESGKSEDELDKNSFVLQYGKSDVDFTKNSLIIRVHVSGKTSAKLDIENLKRGMLGKNEEDFKAYIKTYPEIDSVEINYWPAFISGKIPAYENRINVVLDNK